METTRRTYWLSFCDADRPEGEQFLGVVVVDLLAEDAALAFLMHPEMADPEDGPWIIAAARACWAAGVNPGGQVAAARIDEFDPEFLARYPRLTLLSRADVERLDAEIAALVAAREVMS